MTDQSPEIIGLAEQIGAGQAKPLLSADARAIMQLLLENPQGVVTGSIHVGLDLSYSAAVSGLQELAQDAIASQFYVQKGIRVTAWTLTERGRSVARAMTHG